MKILAFLSMIFFTSNAFAYTRHSDPAAIFVATIIFSVIFSDINIHSHHPIKDKCASTLIITQCT
mgnify:CR=1 FL=1